MHQSSAHRFVLAIAFMTGLLSYGASPAPLADIETAIINMDFSKAKSLAEEFLAQNPQGDMLNTARYYHGLSLLNLEKYQDARAEFDKVILSQSRGDLYDKARIGRVDSFYMSGEYEKSLSEIRELLAQRPQSNFLSLMYLKLARINLRMAEWKEARKFLQKITKEFPDSSEFHLARQLLQEKRFFAIQVGSFLDRQRAVIIMRELQKRGEYAYVVATVDKDGTQFYRVRVGRFSQLDQAESHVDKLSGLGYPTRIYP
jgi:tetratricopeptide (TPR) repeat protein